MRDGVHLAMGVGRYVAACAWFSSLFSDLFDVNLYGNSAIHTLTSGENPTSGYENDYVSVTNDNRLLCQSCAIAATIDRWHITEKENL